MQRFRNGVAAARIQIMVVVVLFLSVPAALYYFLYYEKRRVFFEQRHLRSLGTLARQAGTQLETYRRIVSEAHEDLERTRAARPGSTLQKQLALAGSRLQYRDENSDETCTPGPRAELMRTPENRFVVRLRSSLEVTRSATVAPAKRELDTCVDLPIASLFPALEPAPTGDVLHDLRYGFDEVVLLAPDGTVVHRRDEHSAVLAARIPDLPSALGVKGIADEKLLFGVRYKVFMQPVAIPLEVPSFASAAASAGKGSEDELDGSRAAPLFLVGLVRADEFVGAVSAIKPIAFVLFVVLLIFVLTAWPLGKIMLIGPYERLARSDVVLLVGCTVLATYIVVLVGLVGYAHFGFRHLIEDELSGFSQHQEKQLKSDLSAAHGLMEPFLRDVLAERDKVVRPSGDIPPSWRYQKTGIESTDGWCKKAPVTCPPGLDALSWSTLDGQQHVKFSSGPRRPFITIQDREYFRDARDRRLVTIESGRQAAIQVVHSHTTGRTVAVVAHPTCGKKLCATAGEKVDGIVSISMELSAQRRPVTPVGFQFAVVDEGGRVVLHSELAAHLEEKIFDELDDPRPLRVAMLSLAESEFFSAEYQGSQSRFLVRPIRGTRWFIITIADSLLRDTISVAMVLSGALCFLAWVIWWALLLIGVTRFHPEMKSKWWWPTPDSVHAFRRSALIAGATSVGLLGASLLLPSNMTYLLIATIVPLAVFQVYRELSASRRVPMHQIAGGTSANTARVRGACVLLAASGVVLTAVVPGFAVFRDVYLKGADTLARVLLVDHAAQLDSPACLDAPCDDVYRPKIFLRAGEEDSWPAIGEPGLAAAIGDLLPISANGPLLFLHRLDRDVTERWKWTHQGSTVGYEIGAHRLSARVPRLADLDVPRSILALIAAILVLFLFFTIDFTFRAVDRLFLPRAFVRFNTRADVAALLQRFARPGRVRMLLIDPPPEVLAALKASQNSQNSQGGAVQLVDPTQPIRDPSHALRFTLVDRFEAVLSSADRGAGVRAALEDIEHGSDRVAIIAAGEPHSELESWTGDRAPDAEAWSSFLGSFEKLYFGPESASIAAARASEASHAGAVEILPEVVDAQYRSIWARCTKDEQLLILQAAEEGFVNPSRHHMLRRLADRGVMTAAPPAPFSRGFKQFVLESVDRKSIVALESDGKKSAWSSARPPILAGAAVLLAFLFTTRPELAMAGAVVPALTTTLPAVLNLIAGLRFGGGGGGDSTA